MSPKACLKRHLNQQAMQLLLNSGLKIKEVASQLGFSDEFHFRRFFVSRMGWLTFGIAELSQGVLESLCN
jgi:AraC-like DNA-binding protein